MPAVSATKEGHTRNDLEWLGNSIRPILRVVITVRCHRSPGVDCAEAVSIVGDMPRGMENEYSKIGKHKRRRASNESSGV